MIREPAGGARLSSGVYVGTLRHRRFEPVSHAFRYPVFMVLVDIDRIDELMSVSRFTSRNRFNWASFDDRDHFGDPRVPMSDRVRRDAAEQGVWLPDGPIFLLTHLRYLGYCFNPVSFYYCLDRTGALQFVLSEVHNTFGGSRNYWSRPHDRAGKALYVSPFIESDVQYRFDFSRPGASLVAHMTVTRSGAQILDATLSLERREWDAAEIRRALVRHPLMTAKVVAAIHWEALRLWWKGVPVIPREPHDEPTREVHVSPRT